MAEPVRGSAIARRNGSGPDGRQRLVGRDGRARPQGARLPGSRCQEARQVRRHVLLDMASGKRRHDLPCQEHHRNRPTASRGDERLPSSGMGHEATRLFLLGTAPAGILQDDRPVGASQARRNAGRRGRRCRVLRLYERKPDMARLLRSVAQNLGSGAERRSERSENSLHAPVRPGSALARLAAAAL